MIKVPINSIVPGAVVAKPIYNETGLLLVPTGIILDEKGIRRLIGLGVHEAFILYPELETSKILMKYAESPHIDDIIYHRTRVKAQKLTKKLMTRMLNNQKNINVDKISNIIDEIIDQLLSVDDIILTLSRIRTIDDYTYEHSVNVCVVSLVIGIDLNIEPQKLKQLGTGALLHDVGKISISEDILNKPSTLSAEEYNEVKAHTEIGYQMLLNSGIPEEAAQIALYHHERYDGSGYNRNLCGEEIPVSSRIVTIADSYDAMSNNRVYRRGLSPDVVYKEIAALSGRHFDFDITERFLRRIDLFPVGTGVVLNTNHKGVVVSTNKFLPESPVIRIFKDDTDPKNADNNTNYVDIDLSKTKYLFIKETF